MEDREFDKLFSGLKEREIYSSENAFKNLQEALNKEEKKTKKTKLKAIWWAAAVVASLFVGLGIYSSNKQMQLPSEIVFSEPDFIEQVTTPPKEIETPSLEVAEVAEVEEMHAEEALLKEAVKAPSKTSTILEKTAKPTQLAKVEEVENKEALVETPSDYDKKLAALLEPVEDTELELLLQEKKIAMAIEQLDDKAILDLLRDAQARLDVQEDTQLVFTKADRLLLQAETELEVNKPLKNFLNKAIETGLVEARELFKGR